MDELVEAGGVEERDGRSPGTAMDKDEQRGRWRTVGDGGDVEVQ